MSHKNAHGSIEVTEDPSIIKECKLGNPIKTQDSKTKPVDTLLFIVRAVTLSNHKNAHGSMLINGRPLISKEVKLDHQSKVPDSKTDIELLLK
ncbi:MAG: hypothetical protein WCJ81_05635 [bacterium]